MLLLHCAKVVSAESDMRQSKVSSDQWLRRPRVLRRYHLVSGGRCGRGFDRGPGQLRLLTATRRVFINKQTKFVQHVNYKTAQKLKKKKSWKFRYHFCA